MGYKRTIHILVFLTDCEVFGYPMKRFFSSVFNLIIPGEIQTQNFMVIRITHPNYLAGCTTYFVSFL